jgi:hypothetical protein
VPLLVFPNLAMAADSSNEVGEQFRVVHPDIWSAGVLIDDSADLKKQWSALQAFTGDGPNNTGTIVKIKNCSSFASEGCESDKYLGYQALLPYCLSESNMNCVSDLVATGPDGVRHRAQYVEDFPGKTKYSYVGNPSVNLPDSGSNFIVSIPDMPHQYGDKYLVIAQIAGEKLGVEPTFHLNQFRAGLYAVTVVDGRFQVPFSADDLSHYSYRNIGARAADNSGWDYNLGALAKCAQMSETRCALAWPLPLDVNFEMTLKMKIPVQGWLHGRLQEASAAISTDSNGIQTIKIAGKPVIVPIVYKSFPRSEVPTLVTDFYKTSADKLNFDFNFANQAGQISTYRYLGEYSADRFPEALMWYKSISDTAPYASTAWSFRNIQNGQLGNGCNTSSTGLTGLVSTNSNMYVAQPPSFNRESQSLDYQVTSPHFLPDGSVFKGNYNLVIKSDYARCIYGFSKAPVSATISILSSDGTEQIATTLLSEKDGWIRLNASNFTFSSPTIRVKLSQEAAAPAPSGAPVASSTSKPEPITKTSITCVKGKLKKKITTVNPKCPSGYKKAA